MAVGDVTVMTASAPNATESQTTSTTIPSTQVVVEDEFMVWLRELIGAPKTGWGRANLI